MELEARKRFLINFAFLGVATALIYFIARFLLGYLLPFVIGVAVAFALQRPAGFISKKLNADKGVCAAILTAGSYIVITALLITAVWQAGLGLAHTAERLPDSLNSAAEQLSKFRTLVQDKISLLPDSMASALRSLTQTSFDGLIERASRWISSLATAIARGFPSFLLSCVVTFAASCYIAKDYERLIRFLRDILKPQTTENLGIIKDILVNSVLKLLLGYLILTVITFAELLIGFLVLGIKSSVITAAIIAIVDLLPVIGTGAVLLPWSLLCFVADKPALGIGLLILYLIITVARNFLEPRIVGRQIGITPLLTLLSMFLGLRVAGVAGMLILPLSLIVVFDFYKRQIKADTVASKNPTA